MWNEVSANQISAAANRALLENNTPLLDYATQKHLVLWPLDKSLLDDDNVLEQTPGY